MRMRKALFVVVISCIISSLCQVNSLVCDEKEKQALLSFKHALTDPTNRLSSWSPSADCCGWTGVRCDNVSGRVVGIHLGNWNDTEATGPYGVLGGEISPALLELQFLNHLDLSYNDFGGNPIPTFLGSMQSLTFLFLFNASFGGIVPPQIGNLSSLQYLGLGCLDALTCELHIENFSWISHLSSLETLSIQGIDLHKEVHWLQYVSVLPSLSTFWLVQCQLDSLNPYLKYVNFTSLSYLYLRFNNIFNQELPNWLFNLSSNLMYMDLRGNSLRGQIPSTISNLHNLAYLDLSENHLEGQVPHQLGNLSSLHDLGLGCSDALNCGLYVENFSWISRLSSLESLLLKGMDLHRDVHWLEYLSVLPSLSRLGMIQCRLDNMGPSLEYVNFTSLSVLSLPFNNFNHELPNWLFNLSNLRYLDLGGNSLQGQIPSTISNLHTLVYLNFSDNHLKGPIPASLGQLQYLTELHLYLNSLDGQIPSSIGNLSCLSTLDLHDNQLNGGLPESMGLLSNLELLAITRNPLSGTVTEAHFSKLSHLKILGMSRTYLTFNVSSNWIPPFQLQNIGLRSCKMGPKFPAWLQTQRYLQSLIMSSSGIVDTAPSWLWKWASQITLALDLSDNSISGDLSNVLLNNMVVDLRSNRFTGDLPRLSQNVIQLAIGSNPFPRQISSFLCRKVKGGSKLQMLTISNNLLSGELSDCLMYWPSLIHFSIGGNNISGKIPDSIGFLLAIERLLLSNNSLSGEIPLSLQNCTSLRFLDLAENKLWGNIPSWIGNMSNLQGLSLRSNKLIGDIPLQICQLSSLAILDLANNALSGDIPKCISNFSTMARTDTALDYFLRDVSSYHRYVKFDSFSLVVKGNKAEYGSILLHVRALDFSSNNLTGTIPNEISSLSGLHFLNLSRNHLSGMIPEKVGSMTSLESLDLSRNHLSGTIPGSITNLSFLADLDLSHNNLSGRIPSSTQIQGFDPLRFITNAGLCGPPLAVNCTKKEDFEGANRIEEKGEEFEMTWLYIGMASGFTVSFWGVFGVLILKREWRHAYFRFLDGARDRLYVATVLKMKRLREHLRGDQRGAGCFRGRSKQRRGEREGGGS